MPTGWPAIVNLRADDDGYDVAHLVVVSFNGYVLLAGQVESERLQRRATTTGLRILQRPGAQNYALK